MIKTIKTHTPEEQDQAVNQFEKEHTNPNGFSRVFATQTHYSAARQEGEKDTYISVIFYKEAKP
jgi:hypothetical protein